MPEPLATHDFTAGGLEVALAFFQHTHSELRTLRLVRVSTQWVRLFDINGDFFELRGLGYPDAETIPVLESFDTPFNPETIHVPIAAPLQGIQERPPLPPGLPIGSCERTYCARGGIRNRDTSR